MQKPFFYIESERLKLIPLDYDHLCFYAQPEKLSLILGIRNCLIETGEPFDEAFNEALENFWKPMTQAHPEQYPWFTNWLIVLKSENATIGGIGLSGLPNDAGETETGYATDIKYRNRGYMSEALACLCEWVFQQPDVKAIIAHTFPDGLISQKTLTNNGFRLVGPEITDDGEVLLWRKTISE